LIFDFGIGLKDPDNPVRVICPRPPPFRRVENLAVQKGYNQPLQKSPELEFGLKKFTFVKRAAKASAVVGLTEMPVGNRGYSFYAD